LTGDSLCLDNLKSAGGVFDQDKWVAILQAVINLVVSIVMVILIGLPGVFIGTIVQRVVSLIIRPRIVYNIIFKRKADEFFVDWFRYISTVLFVAIICWLFKFVFISEITLSSFVFLIVMVLVVTNSIFYLRFHKTNEFIYIKDILKGRE